ncbi:MAG: Colicin production protein [Naasia sp.]|uniref:MarP family serine protease n=1 Tax=Naasia sp. TaxID=2546198 RepID=UPI00260DD993|nr:MarP family serine protease [Naasia sp.]MCU1571325.1 Colicin production protein [Naasia sp.]
MTLVLDVLLGLLLVGYLFYGLRAGLLRSIFPIAGMIAGGAAGILLLPVLAGIVPDPAWRVLASLALVLALVVAGNALGALVGGLLAHTVARGPLRAVDKVLGGIATLVVAALVASTVASGLGAFGVPLLAKPIAESAVLGTIDAMTPDPVTGALARFRSLVIEDGIPQLTQALGGPRETPELPDLDTDSAALDAASRSVVRISGNAYACGQSQTGSGFLVAPGRVITNAHVVSGVQEPVVETRQDGVATGRIVYFDPINDLAVIAVDGLDAPALAPAPDLGDGDPAVVEGYPFGGPFTSNGAKVLSVDTFDVEDIYSDTSSPRSVYTLAADVQQGNSGGPLLTPDGQVAGVVFAKSADTANVGYAMTLDEVGPVLDRAPGLTKPVSSGSCVRG